MINAAANIAMKNVKVSEQVECERAGLDRQLYINVQRITGTRVYGITMMQNADSVVTGQPVKTFADEDDAREFARSIVRSVGAQSWAITDYQWV